MSSKKLSRRRVLNLANALRQAMDGRDEPVKDGDGKIVGIQKKPYDFPDHGVTCALAFNLNLLQPAVDAITKGQNALLKKVLPALKPAEMPQVKVIEANQAVNDYLGGTVMVELRRLKYDRLNVNSNKIPPSVLADLLPMLVGVPQDSDAGEEWEEPTFDEEEEAPALKLVDKDEPQPLESEEATA